MLQLLTLSKNSADKTVVAASISLVWILDITNDAGSTTWSLGTTVSDVDLTLNSGNDVTAAFGLAGNTLTVSHLWCKMLRLLKLLQLLVYYPSTAVYAKEARAAYTTVAMYHVT